MKTVDIIEAISNMIENKIIKEWKHEGYIDGMGSDDIGFVIDKEYYKINIEKTISNT